MILKLMRCWCLFSFVEYGGVLLMVVCGDASFVVYVQNVQLLTMACKY